MNLPLFLTNMGNERQTKLTSGR